LVADWSESRRQSFRLAHLSDHLQQLPSLDAYLISHLPRHDLTHEPALMIVRVLKSPGVIDLARDMVRASDGGTPVEFFGRIWTVYSQADGLHPSAAGLVKANGTQDSLKAFFGVTPAEVPCEHVSDAILLNRGKAVHRT
jgi:hypothetical protein